ncbi:MAG: transposase [Calditrichaeota bacterium]|nr:transposase [Calditrichota bacterium]MCB9366138.1 transposase [Calditrichota bacterium]MCB9367104.1 transposase [Calditrichota bacterium]MCB9391589.1 transposase [Calditrichota bacterium]
MSGQRRRFSDEFKVQVVQEVLQGASQAAVARRHNVSANTILLWQKAYKSGRLGGGATGAVSPEVRALELQVAELQRLVGKKEEQIEFLKKTSRYLEQQNAERQSSPSAERSRRKKDVR